MLDGIQTRNETRSPIKGRQLMKAVSPIALFVSKPSRNKETPNQLIPFAIQMGHTKGITQTTQHNTSLLHADRMGVVPRFNSLFQLKA
jgi:hypothetical protein